MKNKDTDTKLNSGSDIDIDETPHKMDLNDNESDTPDYLCTPRTSQPTFNAAIAARSMLKLWLDPDNDDVPPGECRGSRDKLITCIYVT